MGLNRYFDLHVKSYCKSKRSYSAKFCQPSTRETHKKITLVIRIDYVKYFFIYCQRDLLGTHYTEIFGYV